MLVLCKVVYKMFVALLNFFKVVIIVNVAVTVISANGIYIK